MWTASVHRPHGGRRRGQLGLRPPEIRRGGPAAKWPGSTWAASPSENRVALVKLIAEITPGDLSRTQLYSSGAEAVESALRLAKSYTGKTEVIGFWGGFHGKTAGVLPLLGSSFKHGLGPLMPGEYSTPYASCARCAFDKTFPSCEWHCVEFLRRKIELETTNDVAAIIVEPIQGTAGNIVPPPGYLRVLRRSPTRSEPC